MMMFGQHITPPNGERQSFTSIIGIYSFVIRTVGMDFLLVHCSMAAFLFTFSPPPLFFRPSFCRLGV